MADPDAAIELLAKQEALIKKDIEKRRLIYVYKTLIDTAEARELGVGDISDAHGRSGRDHRRILRIAEGAGARRHLQPRVSAAEGRTHAAGAGQLTNAAEPAIFRLRAPTLPGDDNA